MTPKERDDRMRELFEHDLENTRKKGHDYSGDGDALKNFRDFGWQGIVVRIGDKYNRLKCFTKTGSLMVSDESILDTLLDLRVYSMLCQMMFEEERGDKSKV
jgi:hypothetical protein